MKFLTWVSIQCALSVIPKVTYFKLKCIVMLCLVMVGGGGLAPAAPCSYAYGYV